MSPPMPTANWTRRWLFGYVPFTAAAIGIAFSIVAASKSWAALLAGGVLLSAWWSIILISQLGILFVKYNSRFFLKASGITLFNLFGTPFVIAGLWAGIDPVILGEPDVDEHIEAVSAGRCRLAGIKHAKRVGRESYQISGTVECQGTGSQYCVWWFSRRDGKWRISDSPDTRCPRPGSGQ